MGAWLMSLIVSLVVPCFPLGVEWAWTNQIAPRSVLITTTILAASFVFSARNDYTRFVYIIVIMASLLLDIASYSTVASHRGDALAVWLLIAVALIHGLERFYWHVVLDEPLFERERRLFG